MFRSDGIVVTGQIMFFLSRIANYFHNRARQIFIFHDGERWRRADPLVVGTRLEELCPDYQELLDLIAKDTTLAPVGAVRDDLLKRKKDAALKLDAVARDLFGLKPLTDTGGVTGGEAIGVLTQYFLFMEVLAREANVFPVSPGSE